MSVKILAFFDTRYQSSPVLAPLFGDDPWHPLRSIRPVSRRHGPLNFPSTLGAYDLADPNQTRAIVGSAITAGLDGFVVDIHALADSYCAGAAPFAPLCRPGHFGLAWRWQNGKDRAWNDAKTEEMQEKRIAALIGEIKRDLSVLVQDRPLLIVEQPKELTTPAATLALLRKAANRNGLADLFIVGSSIDDRGLNGHGFDFGLDPSPADWASCPPKNKPTGLDILEIEAGLRDSVDLTDSFHPYALFSVTRMVKRETRGRIFPRVFPSFQNWASHQQGGATVLTNGDASASVDRTIYGQFVENAMTYAHDQFPAGQRLVFLDSWNYWLDCSQIEPSLLDGDMVYNTTRNAIDKARYMIRTRGEAPGRHLDPAVHQMIATICDAAAAATGKA